jgi:hypothetical protein
MKKMLIAALAIAAVASPALAKTGRTAAQPQPFTPDQAYAQQQYRPDGRVHSSNPAFDAYGPLGAYVGSDPDPRVRQMLQNDPPNEN